MTRKPFVLVVCDGWGYRDNEFGNAIAQAATPKLDAIMARWPNTLAAAHGEAVGLPDGQIGNSEVGHLTIGTGRVTRQALGRQHHEIDSGQFYENETLIAAVELAISRGSALHIMGLVSPGGVHSHQVSAVALVRLAARLGLDRVHVHAFTDGRDTKPSSARDYLREFESELAAVGVGRVASISGRYFAMDRDNRWDRTARVYELLTEPDHAHHAGADDYIASRYAAGETDEFLHPMAIRKSSSDRTHIEDDDVVVFFNFRADRARQLTHALVDADFKAFERKRVIKNLHLVTFTEYDDSLSVPVAFPSSNVPNCLAQVLSAAGKTQFHIAETEKYAHVTYFLNGGREAAFAEEYRQMIPSPKVAYYDEAPAMSARSVTDALIDRLKSGLDDFLVVNYANADMLGHTGNFTATKIAIECLDACVADVVSTVLSLDGSVLITADHGNAELNIDAETGKPLTAHTTSPVPVILCGTQAAALRADGGLADVAPTILSLMDIETPSEMTGTTLVRP